MRHRMMTGTGLGNPSAALLNNKGTINQAFSADALEKYFSEFEGFDFQIEDSGAISIGIEPTYQYDPLKIIRIHPNKKICTMETGRAWEAYGSGIAKTLKFYDDYKYSCKFTKFIDRWHPVLFPDTGMLD